MKKKLNETGMTNELRGQSLYFQDPAIITPPPVKATAHKHKATKKRKKVARPEGSKRLKPASARLQPEAISKFLEPPFVTEVAPELDHPFPADNQKLDDEQKIEEIRKIVRWLGKEVSFCRFTPAEKSALKSVIDVQRRRGVRTTENEVMRIAMCWLLADFNENNQKSVLSQVLKALNS